MGRVWPALLITFIEWYTSSDNWAEWKGLCSALSQAHGKKGFCAILEGGKRGKKWCISWWEGRGKSFPVLRNVKEVESKTLFWNPCCKLGRKRDGWELKVWLYLLNFSMHYLCLSIACNIQQLKILTDNTQVLHVKTTDRFHISWNFPAIYLSGEPCSLGLVGQIFQLL